MHYLRKDTGTKLVYSKEINCDVAVEAHSSIVVKALCYK
jgi:hypothetical protein